jgi:hypothetical protein
MCRTCVSRSNRWSERTRLLQSTIDVYVIAARAAIRDRRQRVRAVTLDKTPRGVA